MKSSANVVPYLNITARIEGKEEDDLLGKMGGRGFPYCVLMNAAGEVVWEVRPTSQEDFDTGVASAKKLVMMREKLAAAPGDKALEASVNLMDAMGRGQRETPPFAKIEEWAKVPGLDAEVSSKVKGFLNDKKIENAMRAGSREEAADNLYALLKEGVKPADSGRGSINYYYFAMQGAIAAKDAKLATVALEGFKASAKGLPERFKERVAKDIEKYAAQIKEMGASDAKDGGN